MPGPKTRSTKKNTAPKGVAPIGPSNENYLFPGIRSSVIEPRQISWPQVTSDHSDRGYLEPYDPLTGLPTGQAPINPYIPQWQPYTMYGPPMPPAASATPTSAAPNVPPYNPQPNPYALGAGAGNVPQAQELAPKLSTGNVPAGGSYADWQEWNRQMSQNDPNHSYYNPYNSQYAWQWNPDAPGTLMAGADPRSQEGVPWHEALNIPWSSSYAPEFYKNLAPKQYDWVAGRTGGASSKGTGRMPGRYSKPPQRRGETPNPEGNNIPAWVGPLVSWRT